MNPEHVGKWTNPYWLQVEDEAARLNFNDLQRYLGGWKDYSAEVVMTAGAGGSVGNATRTASFRLIGDVCIYEGQFTIGSTTTFGAAGFINISLPMQASNTPSPFTYGPATSNRPVGWIFGINASAPAVVWTGFAYVPPGGTVFNITGTSGPGAGGVLWQTNATAGLNEPFREFFAAGDDFRWELVYRVNSVVRR